jgi:hypothetical protein
MKTKSEMREAAIKRLRETMTYLGYYRELIWAIIGDDFDELTSRECAGRIIDLLTDDDPSADEYIKLPRDENGEVIHLYDQLAGYGYPNGGVICKAIVNDQMILVGRITDTYREWLLWDAYKCHHYHKPTVEDVLCEFAIACEDTGNAGPEVQRLASEYAKRLQLKDDVNED